MKNANSFIVFIFIMALVFVGCKKDKDAEPDNLPIGKNWKITQAIVTTNMGSVDQIPTAPSCRVDDIFRFRDDNTYVQEEGASKCDPDDPQVVDQGTWSKDGDKFVWDGQEFAIEELNKQTFRIKATSSNIPGSSVTITFTAQ